MGRNRTIATAAVVVILAVLVYLQFRTWTSFEWSKLLKYELQWRHIFHGIVFIYVAYFLRALRWKIFLRPVRKHASTWSLLASTLVGFTGLAILGRPGELIRPYLIARRENLSFSSQQASGFYGAAAVLPPRTSRDGIRAGGPGGWIVCFSHADGV